MSQLEQIKAYIVDGAKTLKLEHLLHKIEIYEADNILNIDNLSIQRGEVERPKIGGTRKIECWTLAEWRTVHSFNRDIPDDVDDVEIGFSGTELGIAHIVLGHIAKSAIDAHFQNVGEALAYELTY